MITEDYCSFELAKLLKEKGFDEGCSLVVNIISKGVLPVSWPTTNSDIEDEKASLIALPTLQMAMKWLREVHNIDIFPWKIGKDIYSCAIINSNTGQDLSLDKDFPSEKYEEAVEAAIKYCLENLIDYE